MIALYAGALELSRHGRPAALIVGVVLGLLLAHVSALGGLSSNGRKPLDGSPARAALATTRYTFLPESEAIAVPEVSPWSSPTPRLAARAATVSRSLASWYGPGFLGRTTACGDTLTASSWWVAHRTLPCGTLLEIRHADRVALVPVGDRGPYVAGRDLDLTQAVRDALDCPDLCELTWSVVP